MNKKEILDLDIKTAHDLLKSKKLSVSELCQAFLDEAKSKNTDLNIYLEFFDIEEQVKVAQAKYDNNEAGALTGIPMAIKDNLLFKGHKVSASSKILENYVASYDGDVIKKAKEAGVVILGRVNMDEFAMGSSTENSAFGVTKNPLDASRVPGGSSGGSAAAVASGGAMIALGSDTGGSIRQPASFCGLVGLYPTYGRVSRYGVIAMGSSLDQIGPITKTVADNKAVFELIAGYSNNDAQSVSDGVVFKNQKPVSDKKSVGVPRKFVEMEGVSDSVKKSFNEALDKLSSLGYEIVEVDLPSLALSLAVYYVLMPAEVSSNLARFDGVRYGQRIEKSNLSSTYKATRSLGFGPETRRRIMLGTYVLSSGYYDSYYGKAEKVRNKIRAEFKSAFEKVDFIATPTTPTGAFKIGEKTDPLSMYMADIFTVPANIAGIPAISVPFGKDENNMPLGVQFLAPWFNEDRLFTIGKDLEN